MSRDLEDDLPPQLTMGLLDYLRSTAMDADYAHAARRRDSEQQAVERRPPGQPVPRRWDRIGVRGGIALGLFALFIVTVAAQNSRNAESGERQRQDLAAEVSTRRAALEADLSELRDLRRRTQSLEDRLVRNESTTQTYLQQVRTLAVEAGTVAVTGEGVRVVVDDASGSEEDNRLKVLDGDLQRLANGLWDAGAEAISINGQRLTSVTAIRVAGRAITVNYRSLTRPYTVLAVGDSDSLAADFARTDSGRAWMGTVQQVGLRFSMRPAGSLRIPALATPSLTYASVALGDKEPRS